MRVRNRRKRIGLVCVLAGTLVACSKAPSAPDAALQSFRAEALQQHIRTLASDEYAGRLPGTRGEELTVRYLEEQFRQMGLQPGNPDGTYVQKVPLVGITPDPSMKLTVYRPGSSADLKFGTDFVAWTKRVVEAVEMDGELVFAGYGVQAPEFNWDDFKGVDVKGKVLVVLVNDPPVEDETLFGGKAMTYYGRWTYKYEKAAALGAAGCLIVHETGPAGYPWTVVGQKSGEQFDLAAPDKTLGRLAVEGWITSEQAQKLFRAAGKDFQALKKAAATRAFQPMALGWRAKVAIRNTLRTVDSRNVLAKLTGSDVKHRQEYVVFTAHWDHLGIGPAVDGDTIYNGAFDNASGVATLLEIARAAKQLRVPPRRTLVFLAVTAEEQGLLGARYYAEHPLYSLARTAANINMDGIQVLGRTRDVVLIGKGMSTLDDVAEAVARETGRVVKADPEPEKGFYYRSDHFEFAKQGVPALDPDWGVDYLDRPEGWGLQMREKYTREDYHKPSDQMKDYWDLSGMVEDARFYFLVGYRVANDPAMPEWRPGTEFRAAREASLRQAARE